MLKKNFISIIIPYHKKKFFFKETIQSINNQSYKNFEVIIIYDDTDKSELNYVKKIINNFKFKKKLIINNKIIGDADDLWNKDKLKIQLRFMKDENILFSHSNYLIINHASKKIGSFKVPKNISYSQLIKSCDIGLSSVMISKLLIKKNLFSNLKTKEDYLLWIKLISHLKNFKSINENLIYWRHLKNSLSSSSVQKIDDAFKLYRYHLNFSFLFSIFCTLRLSFYALIKKTIMYLKV